VASGEIDVVPTQKLFGLLVTGDHVRIPISGKFASIAAASVLKANVQTSGVGTSQTIAIEVWGYEVAS
jgi:hypothetical protein